MLIVAVALFTLAADQVTKHWARGTIGCPETEPADPGKRCGRCINRRACDTADLTCYNGRCMRVITVLEGYLDLEYHENPGSAFGLLRNVPGARFILIGVGVLALVVVWRMIGKVEHRRRMADVAFALVAGGALGNVWDRIFIGRVVDFILMHFHRKYIWPAYNVADVALVVGVGLLILVLGRKKESSKSRSTGRRKRSKAKR